MVGNRKVAKWGALASVPWVVIFGLVIITEYHYRPATRWLFFGVAFLTAFVAGVPSGALGAILFVKLRRNIPGSSTLLKATIFSLLVWGLLSTWTLRPFTYPLLNLGSLIGQMAWAVVLTRFLDKDLLNQSKSDATANNST